MEGDSLVLFITFFSYFEFHRRIARHSTCEAHIITKIYRNFRLTLRFGDTLLYISILCAPHLVCWDMVRKEQLSRSYLQEMAKIGQEENGKTQREKLTSSKGL